MFFFIAEPIEHVVLMAREGMNLYFVFAACVEWTNLFSASLVV